MSYIKVKFENGILCIEKNISREEENNIEKIPFDFLEYGKLYTSKIIPTNLKEKNKIIFFKELKNEQNIIAVYSNNNKIQYIYCSKKFLYKKLVKINSKVLSLKLTKKNLRIILSTYIINKYNLNIEDMRFFIDEQLYKTCKLKQYNKKISMFQKLKKENIYIFNFKIKDILEDKSIINGAIKYVLKINGTDISYRIAKKSRKQNNPQHYYSPIKGVFVKDFAIHIRRTIKGELTLVKRKKDPIENTLKFKLIENRFISWVLYQSSKIAIKIRKKKINVFYEKFSEKAEEGAYDLFLIIKDKSLNTRNYFIIDENSKDYKKIKDIKGVVKKYSLKYYWIIYNANNFISTEVPIHLNILRSNNTNLRKSLSDKTFIFLQHGIIYLKNLGKNSPFGKGKEGQVSYIVAGSEKEKDVIVEMLGICEEQVLKTGLPIFSKIKYNHINNKSEDCVTVMLTWKPYEEQLYDFEKSSYYKNVTQICTILKKYVDKIILIAHPKAQELLSSTDLKDTLWNKPISEALEKTKLLITDYSSVCYNSFYQGSGVIFYQPDLELYEKENGKLIPNDDEYIGKRAFNIEELEGILKQSINNKKIDLNKLRTKKFENNYKLINEFSDGKNIERIYQELIKLKLI